MEEINMTTMKQSGSTGDLSMPSEPPPKQTHHITLVAVVATYMIVGTTLTMLGSIIPIAADTYKGASLDKLGTLFLDLNFGLAFGNVGVVVLYFYYQLLQERKQTQKSSTKGFTFVRHFTLNQKICFLGLSVTALVLAGIGLLATQGFIIFAILHFILGFVVSFLDVACNCIAAEDINIPVPVGEDKRKKSWSLPNISGPAALNMLHIGFGTASIIAPTIVAHVEKLLYIYLLFAGVCIFFLVVDISFMNFGVKPDALLTPESSITPSDSESRKENIESRDLASNDENRVNYDEESEQESYDTTNTQNDAIITTTVELDEPSASNRNTENPSILLLAFKMLFSQLRELIKNKGYKVLLAGTVVYTGAEIAIGGWVSSLLEEEGHAEMESTATTVFWAGITVGRLILSVLLSVPSMRSLRRTLQILWWACVLATGSSVLLALLAYPHTLWVAPLVGITSSGILPIIIFICGDMFPGHGSMTAISGALCCANVGAAVFPELAGIIAEATSIRTGLWVGVGCLAGVSVVASFLPKVLLNS